MRNNLLAQINIGPPDGFGCEGNSLLCTFAPGDGPSVLNTVLSTVVGVMTVIAFIWFTIQFFIGAISIIGASGDKAKIAESRARITTGLVGLVVTVAAIFLIDLVGTIIGIDILNPAEFIINQSQL